MDLVRIYKDTINKKCSICNKDIIIKDVTDNNVVYTKTKRKNNVFCHKKCLMKGKKKNDRYKNKSK